MASEALSPEKVGGLRVVDLKEELKTRGLATDGKKVNGIGLALQCPCLIMESCRLGVCVGSGGGKLCDSQLVFLPIRVCVRRIRQNERCGGGEEGRDIEPSL